MMNVLKGFFTGPSGEGSSKRLMGVALLTAGIVYVFARTTPDNAILISLFATGSALLGIAAVTKT